MTVIGSVGERAGDSERDREREGEKKRLNAICESGLDGQQSQMQADCLVVTSEEKTRVEDLSRSTFLD